MGVGAGFEGRGEVALGVDGVGVVVIGVVSNGVGAGVLANAGSIDSFRAWLSARVAAQI